MRAQRYPQQQGMALVVGLVMLLSLTLLGLAAMQNTSLEEKMAGNLRGENIAFQAAEAALRSGENAVAGFGVQPVIVNEKRKPGDGEVWASAGYNEEAQTGKKFSGPYLVLTNPSGDETWWEQWTDALWATYAAPLATSLPYVVARTAGSVSIAEQAVNAPLYVIEEAGYSRDHLAIGQQRDLALHRYRYQITARGTDPAARSVVLLSSTYARRF